LPEDIVIISKGTRFDKDQYSVFDETGFAEKLKRDGVSRLWVGGLAMDVCVLYTVLDGLKSGIEIHIIKNGTQPLSKEKGEKAIIEMENVGAKIEVG
jgi:nicotinamidase/pyrazinamidase